MVRTKDNRMVRVKDVKNVTQHLILCDNGMEPKMESGQDYIFQARVMALCGYGPENNVVGFYPTGGGESCFTSLIVPSQSP